MDRVLQEVVLLKPTKVFLSFLAAQYPNIMLPALAQIQKNTTAYIIRAQSSEEETLDEIEKYFPAMFRCEISRILGVDLDYDIEASFLDFLCCFKFDLHSQIVVMEPSIDVGQNLLCVQPKSVLLKWLRSAMEDEDDTVAVKERVSLSHLTENSTVIVKNFKHHTEVKSFIQHYYYPIFKAEMLRMHQQKDQWPEMTSFQDFCHHFSVSYHNKLIHLY